ncbi:MAG TPA: hypothetical protein VGB71_04115 [Flavisolibacter sp.]|jgi:hypothetical protein
MKISMEKSAGISLLIGAVLMLATIAFHPSGGNLEHLLRIARVNIITHSMALLALPFLGVGFWGLTRRMGIHHFLPLVSYAMMLTGLLAGMIAATINGLALPIYIEHYKEASEEVVASLQPILRNNIALNQAFDFVFLGAVSVSILFWSMSILTLKKLPLWIGYFGLVLSVTAIVMIASGYAFVNLHGFRLFIFFNVAWIVLVAVGLLRIGTTTR